MQRLLLRTAAVAVVLAVVSGCALVSRHPTSAAGGPGTDTGAVPAASGAAVGAAPGAGGGAEAGVNAASIEQYAAVIKANSERSDHESDGSVRSDLAAQSTGAADECLALDPRAAACQYGKAVATGMEARAHPTKAVGLLNGMLQNLNAAESADPDYDQAGPSRVRALVLIRAPGWPLGPGDSEAGLASARKAVSLKPDYPANVLALAEALSKTGDAKGAHESYQRALDLAQALTAGPERDGWLHDAQQGLQQK